MIEDEIVPGDRSAGPTRVTPSSFRRWCSCSALLIAPQTLPHMSELSWTRTCLSRKRRALGSGHSDTCVSSTCCVPDSVLFRALRDLWTDDPSGQRCSQDCVLWLAMQCSERVLRPSSGRIQETRSPALIWPRRWRRSSHGIRGGDVGEDRPQHLLVLGADWSPRGAREN